MSNDDDAGRTTGDAGDADQSQTGATSADSGTDAGSTGDSTPDIDKIVAARVAQKMKQFGDIEQLKKDAEEGRKLAEAQKSEVERERDARTRAEKERDEARGELQTERVSVAIERAASKKGFLDPEDAVVNIKTSDVLTSDGDVDDKALAKELDDLAKRKPHLVGDGKPGSFDGGSRGGGTTGSVDEMFGKLVADKVKT